MKGQLSAPTDTRYLKRGSQKNVSAKWGEVHGYLLELYECQAETFPDDADSDGCDDDLSYDENAATPVIHVTRPDGHHQHHEGIRRLCKLFSLGVGVHVDEREGKTRGGEKRILGSRTEHRFAVAGKRWRRKDLSCLGVPVFVRGKV